MIEKKRNPTTKDVALLKQLHELGQLELAPEFQRLSVWPPAAKAYLIDTIIEDKPIPLMFLQKVVSMQTGRQGFAVIDGQQRLRAIFDFIEDKYRLTQSPRRSAHFNKKFSELPGSVKDRIRNYDLPVQELSGYSQDDIKDIFVRMNRFNVRLSPQELRHAKGQGAFHDFIEGLGRLDFWDSARIIRGRQRKRMRAVEFAAELTILLVEGPQDKKSAIDLYYSKYQKRFPERASIENRLRAYIRWIQTALPDFPRTRYRSPTDLYSLIGALNEVTKEGARLSRLDAAGSGRRLLDFERETRSATPTGEALKYVTAASRQTDNIQPRATRISILAKLLRQPGS